jgi:CspA family cold shock protein
MKLFGTVKTFDSVQGHGQITPEAGGDLIRFDKSAIATWDKATPPTVGQRLSYESGKTNDQVRALNLQTA